jgi:cytochrome P450
MRRVYAQGFTDRALREQAQIIEPYIEQLIQRLRRIAAKSSTQKESIDISEYYGYAALDVISDLTFGESFHSLEGDNKNDWIRKFTIGTQFGGIRNSLSYFYPLDQLFGLLFLRMTSKQRAKNWKYAGECLEKRLAMANAGLSRPDFLTHVIDNLDEKREKGVTRLELFNHSLAMSMAGSLLTTIALTNTTYLLLENPEKYRRLRDEIRSSFSDQKQLTITSTQALPYLSAAIDEALRIHHPTPIHLPRIIGPEGQMVDGQWVPGNVSSSSHTKNRSGVFTIQ